MQCGSGNSGDNVGDGMKLYGLTGGVGMGKSMAGDLLRGMGVAVIDTDVIARQVVEPGQPALQEIQEKFGETVLHPDGRFNREEVARIVFANPESRRKLEGILHPRIHAIWQKQVEQWKAEGRSAAVVTIPLLFETASASLFDATVCVACSAESQQLRLSKRGWNADQIRQRIAAQMPTPKKIALSNFVVWTDTTLEIHRAQLERIFIL